jgi:hypothetical protein
MGKILDAYFLTGIIVTLLCFASGKKSFEIVDWKRITQSTSNTSHRDSIRKEADRDSLRKTVRSISNYQ